jgi:2-dehydro-3-deoxyphosphogluconate aldolase / (4S)-4-hydroxy-2-oxoglutarate aldolase
MYSRLDVLNRIMEIGLIPIFYHPDPDVAQHIVAACAGGGARVVEFTNRGDGAWNVFNALLEQRRTSRADAMLGAGSIVDVATAALYVNSGADFIRTSLGDSPIHEGEEKRQGDSLATVAQMY